MRIPMILSAVFATVVTGAIGAIPDVAWQFGPEARAWAKAARVSDHARHKAERKADQEWRKAESGRLRAERKAYREWDKAERDQRKAERTAQRAWEKAGRRFDRWR